MQALEDGEWDVRVAGLWSIGRLVKADRGLSTEALPHVVNALKVRDP